MPVVRRLVRLIWGDHVDPALRPVLAHDLVGSVAVSTRWSFLGVWAAERA